MFIATEDFADALLRTVWYVLLSKCLRAAIPRRETRTHTKSRGSPFLHVDLTTRNGYTLARGTHHGRGAACVKPWPPPPPAPRPRLRRLGPGRETGRTAAPPRATGSAARSLVRSPVTSARRMRAGGAGADLELAGSAVRIIGLGHTRREGVVQDQLTGGVGVPGAVRGSHKIHAEPCIFLKGAWLLHTTDGPREPAPRRTGPGQWRRSAGRCPPRSRPPRARATSRAPAAASRPYRPLPPAPCAQLRGHNITAEPMRTLRTS
jgi:hypothetical protein